MSYDVKKFETYLTDLVKKRGLTMRQASLKAGLNPGAVWQFLNGRRPHRDSCLLLAEALAVDPNDMLAMVGYEAMSVVDRSLIDASDFPPDVKDFATDLSTLNSERRRAVIAAMRALLQPELPDR